MVILKISSNSQYKTSKFKYIVIGNIIKKISKINQQFIEAARNNQFDELKNLLNQGADIHINGEVALRVADRFGHLEIVKFLLVPEVGSMAIEHGANIHVNDDGALRVSAKQGHLEIVKFLISQGANIHAQDEEVLKTAVKYANEPMLMLLNSFLNKEKLRAAADSNFVSGPNVSMVSSATMPQKQHTELKKIKRSKI